MATEHERIAEIRRRLTQHLHTTEGVRVSIGDDAAILERSDAEVVLSVDAAVENVHFSRAWLSWEEIGARAVIAALSDLAAMGATPRSALLSLICPPSLDDEALYALIDGVANAQHDYRCPVVGGNLARGTELSITTTVVGVAPAKPLLRGGARPGDGLYVTGTLGSAALGLRLLQSNQAALSPDDVARFRRPCARIAEGVLLSRFASAAIDVSDGLLQDLAHVCEASKIGCTVESAKLPISAAEHAAQAVRANRVDLALTGGEDYELLFAAAVTPADVRATRIGTFTAEPSIRVIDASGRVVTPGSAAGFDHFRVGG